MRKFILFGLAFLLLFLAACTSPQDDRNTLDTALETGKPEMCEEITRESIKNECYYNFVLNTEDYSFCDKTVSLQNKGFFGLRLKGVSMQLPPRESCILNAATMRRDVNGCPLVGNENFEDICYQQLSVKNSDPEICDRVSEQRRNLCYSYAASELNLPELCETVGEERDACFMNLAIRHTLVEHCDKINADQRRDNCYFNIVLSTEDKGYCEFISTEERKLSCENIRMAHEAPTPL